MSKLDNILFNQAVVLDDIKKQQVKIFILDEVIEAAKQSEDLPTFLDKIREKSEQW